MSSNTMSLKARIRNLAKEKNVSAQSLLQNFMFECFLDRLARSEYRDKFILKGGLLIASIVGLESRSTMDLDTTVRYFGLTEDGIRAAMDDICSSPAVDDVNFIVGGISPIRPDDIYGGYRIQLTAVFDTIEIPLTIDVTAGDVITPGAVEYSFCGMFDEQKVIRLWAYNIETIIAEKLETILRRNILNTRPRDFYDVVILTRTGACDPKLLKEALAATAAHRDTTEQIADVTNLLALISGSTVLQEMWRKYQKQFAYAADISWESVTQTLFAICNEIDL